jgi:hypothetical protein
MTKKLYQHYSNETIEYKYVGESDKYIFYQNIECDGTPMKLLKTTLEKEIGYGGVWSLNNYNDKIESILKSTAKDVVQSKQMKIDSYQLNIDRLQEDVDRHDEFIKNGRNG